MHATARTSARPVVWLMLAFLAVTILVAPPATATAADGELCSDGGVSVVVDYQDLGGGVERACVEDGAGKLASEVYADAGYDLTPVGAFPGAACQVNGQPADVQCANMPPADAYWGLFVAEDGTWGYAPTGADELRLEDGAFVGFSWQSSSEPAPPGVEPVASTSSADEQGDAQSPAAEDPADESGGIDWWVPVLVVVLLGAAAALVVRRRRGTEPPR